ncbi:MAG: VOC family protein, partial [bacterium]
MKIPDTAKIQSADLRVRDLQTMFEFYTGMIGLKEIERTDDSSFLSANGNYPYLLKLTEDKNAPVRIRGTAGLFHLAYKFPNRKELARVFMRLFDHKAKFQGFSDHIVSEAIYLADPEG